MKQNKDTILLDNREAAFLKMSFEVLKDRIGMLEQNLENEGIVFLRDDRYIVARSLMTTILVLREFKEESTQKEMDIAQQILAKLGMDDRIKIIEWERK